MSKPSEFAALQSAIESVAADRAEQLLKIRRGELISVTALEPLVIDRAHQVRELLLMMPARHVAMIAHRESLDAARLGVVLNQLVRRTLREIARNGPRSIAEKVDGST